MDYEKQNKLVQELCAALAIYADAANWKCPRCGKKDEHNCFMGVWCGPVGDVKEEECGTGDNHGWTIARVALNHRHLNELRATRQELSNTRTMESAQKQLSNELVDRLSKANERIAELEQQLASQYCVKCQLKEQQSQRDRERIEELESLLQFG